MLDSTFRRPVRHGGDAARDGSAPRRARRARPVRTLAAVLAAMAVVAAACGDDDDDSDTASTAASTESSTDATVGTETTEDTTSSSEATDDTTAETEPVSDGGGVLGDENPASGDAIAIGYISDGQSAAVDNSDDWRSAEAASQYVNQYLGGIDGRPIELVVCETRQDPSVATDCANQMVEEGVAAVLVNVSGQMPTIWAAVHGAGLPMMIMESSSADILTDAESTFVLANPLSGPIGLPAATAQEEGVENVVVVVIDVPEATGTFTGLGTPVFANAGAELTVTAIPPGTADMTPQVQAALVNDPGLIHVVGDSTFCTSALQAIRAVGYSGTITAISQCFESGSIGALAGELDGILVSHYADTSEGSDAMTLYNAALDEFGGEVEERLGTAVGAFQLVVTFAGALSGIGADVTPESVIGALKGMGPIDLELSGGIEVQCGGTAVSFIPAVCSSAALRSVLDADGNDQDFEVFEPSELFTLG